MLAELLDGFGVKLRRDRKIEKAIPLCAALTVYLSEQCGELFVIARVVDVSRQVVQALGKRVPDFFVHALRFGKLRDGLFHPRPKLIR